MRFRVAMLASLGVAGGGSAVGMALTRSDLWPAGGFMLQVLGMLGLLAAVGVLLAGRIWPGDDADPSSS